VLGCRPDGFHELETTFQAIALHDTITISQRRGPFRLTCDDPRVPVDRRNLIVQAAVAVWKAGGRRGSPRGFVVELTKRIPIEAGLGGGSSDAAAALRAFGRLWGVDAARLRAIAPALGADVPYFLVGGTAAGTNRGDTLMPLPDRASAWLVLAVPRFGISTRDAFRWWDADNRSRAPQRDLRLENDLQRPVAKRHPEIARIVRLLHHAGATRAAMSGSGSAVYGLFRSRAAADRAARGVASKVDGGVLVTRTLTRAECRRLLPSRPRSA
jgi:4-diphosphocytidyl-2-C-methyl-D-erythritol kinase